MRRCAAKVGIFGGMFDPPHLGHLIIAQHVRDEFGLKQIIFVPAGNPPHKIGVTPFNHRLCMTKLAVAKNKNFLVSAVEKRIRGITYTVDVIRQLKQQYHNSFYLIIGADQWQVINTWKNWSGIIRESRVIIVPRRGHRRSEKPNPRQRIFLSDAPVVDISSTAIRRLVVANRSIRYLTPDSVVEYIRRHRLRRYWSHMRTD